MAAEPLRWDGRRLHVLDQTRLPAAEEMLVLEGADDAVEAIKRLAVRGAPLIGVVAAYSLAMETVRDPSRLESAAGALAAARPTAVNLRWAVERVRRAAADAPEPGAAALAEAVAIHREDEAASAALSRHGADLLSEHGVSRVLTHCNTGCLAASGRGTALGVIAELAERRPLHVLACEARPLLQGARLTVWELRRLGIDHALVVDAAAAGLIRRGEVDAVITGFDRVAANGDVANKVGTYGLALAAAAAGIPFVAAGPSSSLDMTLPNGDEIEIEERGEDEVRHALGQPLTVPGTPARNPAFDITPAALVHAIVTERGVARPVSRETVATVA